MQDLISNDLMLNLDKLCGKIANVRKPQPLPCTNLLHVIFRKRDQQSIPPKIQTVNMNISTQQYPKINIKTQNITNYNTQLIMSQLIMLVV
jgi:hypothetical protein